MAILVWDVEGERIFETGVDHGVLYPMDSSGDYPLGVAWNGLISISESPSGAEASPQYADNIKYLNLISVEEFAATLEAYTYPDEWEACDGSLVVAGATGLLVGQQNRQKFGLAYRTKLGNDVDGDEYGYILHLIYGCTAAPSEKAYNSINDSPEAIAFSWEISTIPATMTGFKPTSHLKISSITAVPAQLALLEDAIFGTAATEPYLPDPDAVVALLTP